MQKSRVTGLAGRYDTFVFDWDGTLNRMDRILKLKNLAKRLLKIYGKAPSQSHKAGRNMNIKGRIEEEEIGARLFARFVDVKMLFSDVRMQDGAVDMLKSLKRRRKAVALLTDADSYIVLKGVTRHNIEDYFDIIVSTRLMKAPKPSPLGLIEVLRLLKAKRGKTLYIGDTLLDYQVAHRVGVDFCAIAGGGVDSYDTFRSAGVKCIFRTVEEMRKSL